MEDVFQCELSAGSEGGGQRNKDEFEHPFMLDSGLRNRNDTSADGIFGKHWYSYDRLGRLEEAIYQNMDFWLTGTINFSYDSWGGLLSGQFLGEDGFDAELEFETDSHGNVLTAVRLFSNGPTQTYTFEYSRHAATQGSGCQNPE